MQIFIRTERVLFIAPCSTKKKKGHGDVTTALIIQLVRISKVYRSIAITPHYKNGCGTRETLTQEPSPQKAPRCKSSPQRKDKYLHFCACFCVSALHKVTAFGFVGSIRFFSGNNQMRRLIKQSSTIILDAWLVGTS